jgi:hypothetical protein
MSISFPTDLDTLTNPTSSDTLDSPSHAGQHADVNDAVEALEAKVGVDDSAVTSSHDYKIGALEFLATADGWIDANETWTYDSVDDPTGVFTVSADVTSKYSNGMRIKMTNGGNTIYGIITDVSEGGGTTTIKFLHEIDPTDSQALTLLANSAITNPYYSTQKAPQGFPLDPDKWTKEYTNTSQTTVEGGTEIWSNVPGHNLSIPIGLWKLRYDAVLWIYGGAGPTEVKDLRGKLTLSTANNSESDKDFTSYMAWLSISYKAHSIYNSLGREKTIALTSKTTYYLNGCREGGASMYLRNDRVTGVIKATCAYL